jgi:hypothetical protein
VSAADIARWARDVEAFAREQPAELAEVIDERVTEQLRRDTGGDGALSNGRALGRATTRIDARVGEAEVRADGSIGLWRLLESGSKPHEIAAPRGRLLRTPYGPRRSVHVRGVRGRRTFSTGAQRGLTDASREMQQRWAQIGG